MPKSVFVVLGTARRVKRLYNTMFVTQRLILVVKLSPDMTAHNNFNIKGRSQLFDDEAQAY